MTFFQNLSAFCPNYAVIDDKDNCITYLDLLKQCDNLNQYIETNQKKLILILAKNNIETIIGYLAGLRANHVVFLLDSSLDKQLQEYLIDLYQPDYIWQPIYHEKNNEIYQYRSYHLYQMFSQRKLKCHDNLNLLLSTSGSTGSPKLVRLSKSNLNANAKSIVEYLKLDNYEKPITSLSINYSYGLSVVNSHLMVGATILLTEHSIITKDFWNFFRNEKATSISGVPYTYQILKKLNFFKMKLPSLKYMTQAGNKLDNKTILEFAEFLGQKKFYVMYGQTEATARISYLPPQYANHKDKCKSVGLPVPGGKMWLLDENNAQITIPYKEGKLVYSGKNVMMGYAENPNDLSKGDELDGILHTGDIAYFDVDGFFYITGRLKRFIKIFGIRINLIDIELFLNNNNCQCVCGGEDDKLLIGCEKAKDINHIKEKVLNKYSFHSSTVKVFQIQEIKRNSSGKILYKEIFKPYLSE